MTRKHKKRRSKSISFI